MLLQRNNNRGLLEKRPPFPQEDHSFFPQEDPRLKAATDTFAAYQLKRTYKDNFSGSNVGPSGDLSYSGLGHCSSIDSNSVVDVRGQTQESSLNPTNAGRAQSGLSSYVFVADTAAKISAVKGTVFSLDKEGLHRASTKHLPQPLGINASLNEKTESSTSERITGKRRAAALDWVEEHRVELERFPGQWLLIINEELIAHSAAYNDILRIVKERRPLGAVVHYVPQAEERSFIL